MVFQFQSIEILHGDPPMPIDIPVLDAMAALAVPVAVPAMFMLAWSMEDMSMVDTKGRTGVGACRAH